MKIGKVIRDYVRRSRNLPQMVVILLDDKESKQYKDIKETACKKLGVLS